MGRMIDGNWTTEWYTPDSSGAFKRPDTVFRNWIETDGRHVPESDRYHLFISNACPWAHRTMITRALHGLEEVVPVSIVASFMGDDGWIFDTSEEGATQDHLFASDFLREIYAHADPQYSGRVTVPILWDKKEATIVNNESKEIVKMFDEHLAPLVSSPLTLFPETLEKKIWETVDAIYEPINNGVYRCGFAGSQSAYEIAFGELFDALDHWESVLATQRYTCGDTFTAADIFMFTTLVRFDAVYHTHFKTNRHRIVDFPNLWGFVREIYQMEKVAATVNMDHIKHHYFASHDTINPKRIVPLGPVIDFESPHNRGQTA